MCDATLNRMNSWETDQAALRSTPLLWHEEAHGIHVTRRRSDALARWLCHPRSHRSLLEQAGQVPSERPGRPPDPHSSGQRRAGLEPLLRQAQHQGVRTRHHPSPRQSRQGGRGEPSVLRMGLASSPRAGQNHRQGPIRSQDDRRALRRRSRASDRRDHRVLQRHAEMSQLGE